MFMRLLTNIQNDQFQGITASSKNIHNFQSQGLATSNKCGQSQDLASSTIFDVEVVYFQVVASFNEHSILTVSGLLLINI